MDNSYFIFTDTNNKITLERFHVCSWEFKNSSLVEFGLEIQSKTITNKDSLCIHILIPWLTSECKVKDLYDKLRVGDNSRFIFNDSISETKYLADKSDRQGVIHIFSERNQLCFLPVEYDIEQNRFLKIKIDLKNYNRLEKLSRPNLYVRFWVEPTTSFISIRKKGVNKSTVIYDFKINELRNISAENLEKIGDKPICKIKTCFVFTILPNDYDVVFLDSNSLKHIRTLEYESFAEYLGDKRIKKNELVVVFNKKDSPKSFSFFSSFAKERIGPAQIAIAMVINILAGLLFLPPYKDLIESGVKGLAIIKNLPSDFWISIVAVPLATTFYIIWPKITEKILKKISII